MEYFVSRQRDLGLLSEQPPAPPHLSSKNPACNSVPSAANRAALPPAADRRQTPGSSRGATRPPLKQGVNSRKTR
ncbi:hypothetical protein ST47_g9063 [Ascochyta rabiei]|uniref:Uncharacterized protein n=1 Tax=Didymella rabiei TaxID=5454 RepID=A0A162XY46_DIDRA|nr:hypothetical protein ST47_g9063 [Ascochyta rabiei]